jgi:hypothetical protein
VGETRMSSGPIVVVVAVFVLWTCHSVGSESGEKEAIIDPNMTIIEPNKGIPGENRAKVAPRPYPGRDRSLWGILARYRATARRPCSCMTATAECTADPCTAVNMRPMVRSNSSWLTPAGTLTL